MDSTRFVTELKKLNININDDQLAKLDLYYRLLIEWNEKINLTSITNREDVYLKHFYDSLTLCKAINLTEELSLCDLGTGAGFPGMVVKIMFPNIKVTLVDSLRKRTIFLENVINKLSLKNIEVINERAEIYSINNREKYDIVTARAVSKLNILLEYSIPLLKISGHFVAMKASCSDEIKSISNALNELDCTLNNTVNFCLPIEESSRTLIDIIKNKKTSNLYPRKFDKIKKNPL